MSDQFNPDDPRFRTAVTEILAERIDEVFTRVRNELETAGYPEAAEHVRRTFSE
jgi:cell division ATPase FtsA